MSLKKIEYLTSLIDINLTRRESLKSLDSTDIISGYDLFFVINLIIRNKFSGNLVIVNENDDVSGIRFNNGGISKIDLLDQDSSISNLMLQDNMLTKPELQSILDSSQGKNIDQLLLETKGLSSVQITQLLLKQTNRRLEKYLHAPNIRVNFNREETAQSEISLNEALYFKILYNLIYRYFKNEWITEFKDFYSKKTFSIFISDQNIAPVKDFNLILECCEKLKTVKKQTLSFNELISEIGLPNDEGIKLFHFLVLAGFILIQNTSSALSPQNTKQSIETDQLLLDLKRVKKYILTNKYYDALGLINKYSSLMNTNDFVRFYFIWVKLHGAFYNNFLLDSNKISTDLSQINPETIGPSNYYYVLSLLEAYKKQPNESLQFFKKAVAIEDVFSKFPIIKNTKETSVSFWDKIKKAIS